MDVTFKKCEKLKPVQYKPNPKFGTVFAPHLLRIDFDSTKMDQLEAHIVPYGSEPFKPSSIVLHYGQSIFEGLKVFRQGDGTVAAFRADLHARRFMKSAEKLAMPPIDEHVFLSCLDEYLKYEKDSVPSEDDHALYLRPLMIGRDDQVKVSRSKNYTFYIMSCVVGGYFAGGVSKPASVLVNRQFVRAFPGGLGEAKTAANYAVSLAPQAYAETQGCDQVLYLDAVTHDFVDELGGMNFFMVKKGDLITPKLTGTVLHGVTRQTILDVASQLGLRAREEMISFSEMLKGIRSGDVTETFACGTAAVVHSIGELVVQDQAGKEPYRIKLPAAMPVASKVLEHIKKLQRGLADAPPSWFFGRN